MKIYLAGPDVFFTNANDALQAKKNLCLEFGHVGRSPFDNEAIIDPANPSGTGLSIAEANFNLMEECDAVIANLTPFRGPSADIGTACEVFHMAALGKKIFGYSNVSGVYADRAPTDTYSVEKFDLWDNLMLPGIFARNNGIFCQPNETLPIDDLKMFRQLLERMP